MKKLLNYIIGVFGLLFFIPLALANGGDGYFHMMDGGFGYRGLFGFGFINMIIFWGVLIALIVALIKYFTQKENREEETPLEILKKRLAKGEISEEEFDKLKKKL